MIRNQSIRNFVIIAHVDHGKSTLADRFLEITGAVSPHKMKAQYLDRLDLERERGITIKMAPVRMQYKGAILNLIDTPGHSDFSYEVSRALKAVEGAILLVDATQGIQAQTLANLEMAKGVGLKVIGALNKIDLNPPGQEGLTEDLARLLAVGKDEIYRVSGKTGEGVPELLDAVIKSFPDPRSIKEEAALIFSSLYHDHKGVLAFVRVFGGQFKAGDMQKLLGVNHEFKIKEVGYFAPEFNPTEELAGNEIGYIATGIKDPEIIKIGDTIGEKPMPGFAVSRPVVFVSLYPDESDDYDDLKRALGKLKLHDSSLIYTPDFNLVLGRGFKCGFLGRLHFEITIERLEREFGLTVVSSFPSVAYMVRTKSGENIIENPKDFPDEYLEVREPMVRLKVLTPQKFLGAVLGLTNSFRLTDIETRNYGSGVMIEASLPLSELILDFDDRLKSASEGFASFSYEIIGFRKADVKRLDVLLAGELVPGLSRVIHREDVEAEGRTMAVKLKELLPRKQFAQAIQAVVGGRIMARETIPALSKNVTAKLYGGDRTRKMKLWKKQKAGKKKLEEAGKATVPAEIFKELLKKGSI